MATQPSTTVSPRSPNGEARPLQSASTHDGEMLEQLLTGMLHHRMHVVLSSATATATEPHRAALLQRLCDTGLVQIDDASGRTTELLLQRFNALVAAMPMEQAMNRSGRPVGPVTVFLLQAFAPAPSAEFRLLARLANDLPGANVRILLVLNTVVDVAAHVQALGRNVLHWAIRPLEAVPEGSSDKEQLPTEEPVAARVEQEVGASPTDPGAAPAGGATVPPVLPVTARVGLSRPAGWRGTASCLLIGVLGLSALAAATQAWPPRAQHPAPHQQPAFELQRSPDCGTSRGAGRACAVIT